MKKQQKTQTKTQNKLNKSKVGEKMKSIFEIINSQSVPEEPTPQPQIQPEPVAQKPQPKLFMQQLIQHGKTDISTYVLKPQKSLTPAILVKNI